MPYDLETRDEKNNRVVITLFESHLAKFMLNHPELYQAAYLKLFETLKLACASSDERLLFSVFSLLNHEYPEYHTFGHFQDVFYLPAADYLLKLISDYLIRPTTPSPTLFQTISPTARSPVNLLRSQRLFADKNRGVIAIEPDEVIRTKAIGIVSPQYRPYELEGYFTQEIEASGQYYKPDEDSYVAGWLRKRQLPIISGASGSTEALITRLFQYAPELTKEEQQIIIFTQACNMIANGHHSLFEALLVADDLELITINDTETQKAFYLQCVPEKILTHETFTHFMASDLVSSLLPEVPATAQNHTLANTTRIGLT
ncbi:MAG: hypothetical protein P1U61_04765 [Legionellaceae bacterium]|nr:hypothetical protein [Legionellaceae bacterium]